jgi:hypothetical protein
MASPGCAARRAGTRSPTPLSHARYSSHSAYRTSRPHSRPRATRPRSRSAGKTPRNRRILVGPYGCARSPNRCRPAYIRQRFCLTGGRFIPRFTRDQAAAKCRLNVLTVQHLTACDSRDR